MRWLKILIPVTLALLLLLPCCSLAEPAEELTSGCTVSVVDNRGGAGNLTDGKYSTWWNSTERTNPWVIIASDKPVYGLYVCFTDLPDSYVIQEQAGEDWTTAAESGGTGFYHAFFELNGQQTFRILSDSQGKSVIGISEIHVFGKGDVPEWVQRWEPPAEKADLLFFVAHPDDEILFFGGAIPTYAAEKGKSVQIAYLTDSRTFRRSEALNGLWAMGVRHYPEFGWVVDKYPITDKVSDGYIYAGGEEKVLSWVTGLFRKYRPEVVVTLAENGEYGHPQHKMTADSAEKCFELAADASRFPESAAQYGVWQVKKMYHHQYGDEEREQTVFDWNQPLAAFGGKTGAEIAEEAFALHVSQQGAGIRRRGKFEIFTVEKFGVEFYPYNRYVLYSTTVGEDVAKNDFLEHTD